MVATPELPAFKSGATTMPEPAAIIRRWQQLCEEECGLEVRFDKSYAASEGTALDPEEFGGEDGVQVRRGVVIMGIPCGSRDFERALRSKAVCRQSM